MALDPRGLANSNQPQITVWHIPSANLVYRCRTKAEAARFVFDGANDPDDFSVVGYLGWPEDGRGTPITVTREDVEGE